MIRNLTGKSGNYEYVFFDFDGTVTDSGPGLISAAKYMFDKIGYTGYDEKMLWRFVGPPVTHHLQKEYGFTQKEAEEATLIFRDYYKREGIYQNSVYDGIAESIRNIRSSGKKVYVATSKPEPQVIQVIERFNLSDLFDDIFAARYDLGIYYKADVLDSAVDKLGGVGNAVMVGDRVYDIEGGRHVGIDTVGVLYGYGDKKELEEAGCDYIVDTPEDISCLLGRH
jgi:phosphoglycolate phosphatase